MHSRKYGHWKIGEKIGERCVRRCVKVGGKRLFIEYVAWQDVEDTVKQPEARGRKGPTYKDKQTGITV